MGRNRVILYFEDDHDDVELLTDAIHLVDKHFMLINATDGEEGLTKLDALVTGNKPPCLIILDVNMPKLNGREVIATLKGNKGYDNIPVIVFTTSKSDKDKHHFLNYGVEVLHKPSSFSDYLEVAK